MSEAMFVSQVELNSGVSGDEMERFWAEEFLPALLYIKTPPIHSIARRCCALTWPSRNMSNWTSTT